MKVLGETDVCIYQNQNHRLCSGKDKKTNSDKGGDSAKAGEHPGLNREHDLWREGERR